MVYHRFGLHHGENTLGRTAQRRSWTHADNHSVHLHTQRGTRAAEAVRTKQHTERSMFLVEKSDSAPSHRRISVSSVRLRLCDKHHSSLTPSACLGWGNIQETDCKQSVLHSQGARMHWLLCCCHMVVAMARRCKAGI